jgi:hypothetical protein
MINVHELAALFFAWYTVMLVFNFHSVVTVRLLRASKQSTYTLHHRWWPHNSRNAFGDGNSDKNFPEKFKSENFPPHITKLVMKISRKNLNRKIFRLTSLHIVSAKEWDSWQKKHASSVSTVQLFWEFEFKPEKTMTSPHATRPLK